MKSYKQLEKRIAREKQLTVAQQKMEVKKLLQVSLGFFLIMQPSLKDNDFSCVYNL